MLKPLEMLTDLFDDNTAPVGRNRYRACSVCGSKTPHKHAYRPGDKPQIDVENKNDIENKKPLPEPAPVEPSWSHFHAEGISIKEPQTISYQDGGRLVTAQRRVQSAKCLLSAQMQTERHMREFHADRLVSFEYRTGGQLVEELEQLSDPFDYSAFTTAVGRGKLDIDLRSWVHSQERHTIDPNIQRLRAMGRYKTTLHLGDYNSSEESYGESGDAAGVAAPISAHKVGKYYSGSEDKPEADTNTMGVVPYIPTGSSAEFNERGLVDLRKLAAAYQQMHDDGKILNINRRTFSGYVLHTLMLEYWRRWWRNGVATTTTVNMHELRHEFESFMVLEAGRAAYSFKSAFRFVDEPADVQLERDRMEHPVVRLPMCPINCLPEKYCSHCQKLTPIIDTPPQLVVEEDEPIRVRDEEPDVFAALDKTEDGEEEPEEELDEEESDEVIFPSDTPLVTLRAEITGILDDPEKFDADEQPKSGSGADIDALLKHKGFYPWSEHAKPWRGRTPWWRAHWPGSHMLAPVYGYGKFRHQRWGGQLYDQAISIAGMQLVWLGSENGYTVLGWENREAWTGLHKNNFDIGVVQREPWEPVNGLIWKEKWTEPYCVTCGHYIPRLDAPAHNGHNVYTKSRTQSYGHSILYSDIGWAGFEKWRAALTYIDTTHISNSDKWQKMIEHERESMEENLKAARKLDQSNFRLSSKYRKYEQLFQDALVKKITEEDVVKQTGMSVAAVRTELSRLRHEKVEDLSDEVWRELVEGKEPGIYTIAGLERQPLRAYKIADLGADQDMILEGFDKAVRQLLAQRASKNRIPSINGNGALYRKRARERGYDPLPDGELAYCAVYWQLAQELGARPWRTWPGLNQFGVEMFSVQWTVLNTAAGDFYASGIPEW